MNSSLESTNSLLSLFSLFLTIGIGSFVVMMLGMMVLFGLSMKETMKHAKGIMFLFVLSLIIPLLVSQMYQNIIIVNQAATKVQIENIKIQTIASSVVLLSFNTTSPVMGFIEYKDLDSNEGYPIFQSNKTQTNIMHSYVINNVGKKGGEVIIILDGKRYLINNKPIQIEVGKD